MEESKSLINNQLVAHAHKPLIYILPTPSSNLNQLLPYETQKIEKEVSKGFMDSVIDSVLFTSQVTANLGIVPIYSRLIILGLQRLKEVPKSTEENPETSQEIRSNLKSYLDRIKLNITDWIESIEQIPVSKTPQEINFPPGHPLPSRLYRVHPLRKKSSYYIPVEVFDSLLYEERESELIKLLVDLGAVEITIKNLSSNKTKGGINAKASASTGGLEAKIEGEKETSDSETRLIKLSQKTWNSEEFNVTDYSWLAYEPAWEALVHARLKGNCLLSSVELNSDTSYSIFANLGLTEGLIQQFADVGGGIELSNLYKESKLFEVKFVDA